MCTQTRSVLIIWTFIATLNLIASPAKALSDQEGSISYPATAAPDTTVTSATVDDVPQTEPAQIRAPGPDRRGGKEPKDYYNDPAFSIYTRDTVRPDRRPGGPGYRQGYGYGYPGYRGQGGSGYPQHRQYRNPPPYPPAPSSGAQPAPVSAAGQQATDKTPGRPAVPSKRKALLHAAGLGELDAVQALLKLGANANARANNTTGRTALILAAAGGHVDIVDALLTSGARIDDRDRTGHSALNWAAMRGRTDVAATLLDQGADVDTRDNSDVTPVHYAIGTRNIALLELLVASDANLEVETRATRMTPLLLAIELDDIRSLNLLLDNGAKVNTGNRDNYLPLMAAAEKGRNAFVQILLARDADINARDNKQMTPLIYAADNRHIETMLLLASKGADIDARDKTQKTAIMRAAIQGNAEIIRALHMKGGDVNATDINGSTALMLAVAEGQQNAVKALLASGADSGARNSHGVTALMLAEKLGRTRVAELLRDHR